MKFTKMTKKWGGGELSLLLGWVMCFAQSVFAEPTTNYWVGGSGNWSEKSNWFKDSAGTIQADTYPGDEGATDVHAIFTSKAKGTITIDKDVTIPRFIVEGPSSASSTYNMTFTGPGTLRTTITADGAGTRTRFTGNRTITMTDFNYDGTFLDFDKGKAVIGAGANIKCSKSIYVWHNNASLRVLEGCNITASKFDVHYEGASLSIEGGTINASFYSVGSTRIEISGGDITVPSAPSISKNGTFIFTNGTLTVTAPATTTDRRLLGQGNAVFRSTLSPEDSSSKSTGYIKRPSINVFTEDGDTATFSGTIIATNGNYSALHFTNSVTVNANVLNLSRVTIADVKDVTLNAKRVNLGRRIYPTLDNPTLTIPYGTTFGAFGDWYVYVNNNRKFTLYLNGDIIVDTIDCFDGVTPHTIGFWKTSFMPFATLTVCGNGTCDLAYASVPDTLRRVEVMDGATLQITNNTTATVVDDFSLGANSILRLRAGRSPLDAAKFTFDPTAAIEMVVPSGLSYAAYMVAGAQDDASAAALAARTTLTGVGAGNWTMRTGAHTVYLANGVEPTYGEVGSSNIWTGAVSGYWDEPGNWVRETLPASSGIYFGGTRNLYVTNNVSGTLTFTRLGFLPSCGPICLSGGKFNLTANGYKNKDTSPIYSFSRLPAIIESDLTTDNALSVCAAHDSYVALNGTATITKTFRPSGDVRVGGTVTAAQLYAEATCGSGRRTKLQILSGGKVVITAQATDQDIAATRLVVDGGGTLEYRNGKNALCSHTVTHDIALINGLVDVKCPYTSKKYQVYYGTGVVQFASVKAHTAGSASIFVGGGLTVKPSGNWTTTSAEAPDNYIRLALTNDAVLSASANWTYGPEAGVETTTTAAERALEIADGATLTVKTDGYTASFADPIVGSGNLVIEEGSKVALAGDLFASAKDDWTTFATVGSFTAAPGTLPENYRVRTVDNGDGTVSVQAKLIHGLMFTIR